MKMNGSISKEEKNKQENGIEKNNSKQEILK